MKKIETRYYLFENVSTAEKENIFISQLILFSERIEKFNCGIGEFIISITAFFDDSCEQDGATPLDIMHNFRKDIRKLKEYKIKPSPKKYWLGEWIVLKPENPIRKLEAIDDDVLKAIEQAYRKGLRDAEGIKDVKPWLITSQIVAYDIAKKFITQK
jgi:hypothetical protein